MFAGDGILINQTNFQPCISADPTQRNKYLPLVGLFLVTCYIFSYRLVISGHAKCLCWSPAIQVRFPIMYCRKTSGANQTSLEMKHAAHLNHHDNQLKYYEYHSDRSDKLLMSLLCFGSGDDVAVDFPVQFIARKLLSGRYLSYVRWYSRPTALNLSSFLHIPDWHRNLFFIYIFDMCNVYWIRIRNYYGDIRLNIFDSAVPLVHS